MWLKVQGDPSLEDILNEVVEGIRVYFNKALGNVLLYRFERPQYSELKKKLAEKDMSEIYGPEHLLRLFGNLFLLKRSFLMF